MESSSPWILLVLFLIGLVAATTSTWWRRRSNMAQLRVGEQHVRRILLSARSRPDVDGVREALRANGRWEEHREWRISTVSTSRIVPERLRDLDGYRVSVSCDFEFSAWCPTVERAAETVGVYRVLLADLFYGMGWPGNPSALHLDAAAPPASARPGS